MTIALTVFAIPTLIAAVVLVGLLDPLIHPAPARSSAMTHPIDPAGQEVRRLQTALRATEKELGEERQLTASLNRRLLAAEARVTALEIHTAQKRVAAADVPCGELLRGQTITDAGSIDTWEDQ